MSGEEGKIAVSLHGITITINVVVILLLLKVHAIFVKLRERINLMYADFCDAHDIPFKEV